VSRIQSVNKVLEQIATGEDPDIIFEHSIELGDNHHCENVNHYYKIKTFQEINLNDPFPKTVKSVDKPYTAAMTANFESKKLKRKDEEFEEFEEEEPIQYDISRLN